MNGQKNDNQFEKMVRHRIEKELCQTTKSQEFPIFFFHKKIQEI